MRSAAKLCLILTTLLLVVSTFFQVLALISTKMEENSPLADTPWLVPVWIAALVMLPVSAILCSVLKEHPHWLQLPLLLAVAGGVLALIVALALKNAFPAQTNEIGMTQGLTAWRLCYRHLSSVAAGVLTAAAAALHMGGCREDRIRRENQEYRSVYDLSGDAVFKDNSTLGLETYADEKEKPARRLKRSLRHAERKQKG